MAPSATSFLSAALGGKVVTSAAPQKSSRQTGPSVKSLRGELKQIGLRIRETREAANITQQELGKILGVSNKTVSAIELANVEPSITQLIAIARTLSKPVGYFVGETLPNAHEQLQSIEQQLTQLKKILSA